MTQNNQIVSSELVNLPDTIPLKNRSVDFKIDYTVVVDKCASTSPPQALYIFRVGAPYAVFASGATLPKNLPHVGMRDQLMQIASDFSFNGRVPALFSLPASTGLVNIKLQTLPYMPAGLTLLYVGDLTSMAVRQSEEFSAISAGSDLVAGLSLFLGFMAILLCFFRKNDFGLRWFAIGSFVWGLRNIIYLNPNLMSDGFITEMLLSYGIVASGTTLTAATLYACNAMTDKVSKIIRIILIIVTVALILGIAAAWLAPLSRAIGFFAVMGLLIWATWLVAKASKLHIPGVTKSVQYAMIGGVAMQLVLGLHDFGIVLGLRPPTSSVYAFWGYSCWVLALAAFSSARVVKSLDRAQNANKELEERVAQKNAELKSLYDAAQEEQLRSERARLNREIHDGIGAQLMTALRGVERGALSQEQITDSLQEGLDELRLLMDSADIGHHLHGALFAWRNRWEPRLSAVNLALYWHVADEVADVRLAQNVILQIIRILQESVANVVKHAKASRIDVDVRVLSNVFVLSVTDDGIGITQDAVSACKRGLKHMQQRATLIGATYNIDNVHKLHAPEYGTSVRVELRL